MALDRSCWGNSLENAAMKQRQRVGWQYCGKLCALAHQRMVMMINVILVIIATIIIIISIVIIIVRTRRKPL